MEGKRKGRRSGGTGEKKQKRKQERRQYLASEKGVTERKWGRVKGEEGRENEASEKGK